MAALKSLFCACHSNLTPLDTYAAPTHPGKALESLRPWLEEVLISKICLEPGEQKPTMSPYLMYTLLYLPWLLNEETGRGGGISQERVWLLYTSSSKGNEMTHKLHIRHQPVDQDMRANYPSKHL